MTDLNAQLNSTINAMVFNNLTLRESLDEFEKRWITAVLQAHRGNQCSAARELRMHRNNLGRLVAKFRIDVRAIRKAAGSYDLKVVKRPAATGAG
jgi:transcriptional regulator with GAF, ATPase, and Fis domain